MSWSGWESTSATVGLAGNILPVSLSPGRRADAMSSTLTPQVQQPNPLDRLLESAAEKATDPAVRKWLGALLDGDECASGGELAERNGMCARPSAERPPPERS
jgi:hypothetical protein